MALNSLGSGSVCCHAIQGALVLLTWPGPFSHDTTFTLAGLLIHAAMQIGLHMPISSQDFARVPIKTTDEDDKIRANTWAYCLLLYHRTCTNQGQALPLLSTDLTQHNQLRDTMSTLPSNIRLQVRSHIVVARAMSALQGIGLVQSAIQQSSSIAMILDNSIAQIDDVEAEFAPLEDVQRLYLSICSLTLQTMHFYEDTEKANSTGFVKLYSTCCGTIKIINDLNSKRPIVMFSTMYIFAALLIAATNLLRLIRGGFISYISRDVERGEAAYELALSMMTRMSIVNEGLPHRCATMLSSLWTSHIVFRRPDGSIAPELRIRTRLAISPLVDCLWWYRVEFRGQRNVYGPRSSTPTAPLFVAKGADPQMTSSQKLVDVPGSNEEFDNWIASDGLSLSPWPSFLDFNDFLV